MDQFDVRGGGGSGAGIVLKNSLFQCRNEQNKCIK